MIDPLRTKSIHLLAAIPVAAIAGALFLPIVMGIGVFITGISSGDNELMRPFKNWDITVTDTLFVSLYFLPFATLAGCPDISFYAN